MICRKVRYKNFRNIDRAELSFDENVTVLNGKNGQGKTNILEGIYLFAGGRSFRTVHENELIGFGQDYAELEMVYFDGRRDNTITLRFVRESGKRFCKKNGVVITRLSELVGNFRAVLFCPEHLSIVKDGPAVRRKFLDYAISQTDPVYLRTLQKYNKILSQRNALIKMSREKRDDGIFLSTAEFWSDQLAREAEIISQKRSDYVSLLDSCVKNIISDMTQGKEECGIYYQSKKSYADYMAQLTENTERELRFGATLYGIHKDDLRIELCGKDARSFASQGQQRSIALAMKLAEGEISKQLCGEYPVFLFDDILSELDHGRRKYLLDGISGKQVIITSCDSIDTRSLVYKVKEGKIFS